VVASVPSRLDDSQRYQADEEQRQRRDDEPIQQPKREALRLLLVLGRSAAECKGWKGVHPERERKDRDRGPERP
jgi:hypothetical protein